MHCRRSARPATPRPRRRTGPKWASTIPAGSAWPAHPLASWSNWDPAARANVGFVYCHGGSLALAELSLRGKFHIDDPARAEGLKLSLVYRGGAAVFVNGREVARDHLPAAGPLGPDPPVEMYPREAYYLENGRMPEGYGRPGSTSPRLQLRLRTLNTAIPPGLLRQGTNVLAIGLYRAPLPKDVFEKLKRLKGHEIGYFLWDACGLYSVRLTAPATTAVQANAARSCRRPCMELQPAGVGHGPRLGRSERAAEPDLHRGDAQRHRSPARCWWARTGDRGI